MIGVQIILYCLLFVVLVKYAVRENGIHCMYFYPKEYIDKAQERGIIDKAETMKKGKRFMIVFCVLMLVALIAIIAGWNHVTDFKTAYIQSALFLILTNWFDGIVVDRLWVGHSKIWIVQGMEDVSYVKPWKDVIVKRTIATVLYLIIAFLIAEIIVLL